MSNVDITSAAGIKALSEALGWTDVRSYGAKGDDSADDTVAIKGAIAGATGKLYFPPGIYCISDTLVLRSAIEYVGPQGGTFLPNQEHPTAGYGACLKWIGSAGGTMVKAFNFRSIKWHGIDLDGVDYTDDVQGFLFDDDNTTVAASRVHMEDTCIFNCGDAITIGTAASDWNLDNFTFNHIHIYLCNNGIISNTQNLAYSSIKNCNIGIYKKGIYLNYAGFAEISNCAFSAYQNRVAGDGFIVLGVTGAITIKQTQGEAGAFTGWKHLVCVNGVSTFTPITLSSNVIDCEIELSTARKVISTGNQYNAGVTFLAGGSGIVWDSQGDHYGAGIGITDSGTNNIIVESTPEYNGNINIIYRSTFNNTVYYQLDYDGKITIPYNYQWSVDTNPHDLGVSANGGSGGSTLLISCSGHLDVGNNTCSELFLIRLGYDGDNVEATSISRDEGLAGVYPTWTFGVTAGHNLSVTSSLAVACKYKIISQ